MFIRCWLRGIGVRGGSKGRRGEMEGQMEKWLMGNIIPVDVNVVTAVINRWWKKMDGVTEQGGECVPGC